MTDSPAQQAVNHVNTILDNRRHVDSIRTSRVERIREQTRHVATQTLLDDGETTLRDWAEPLDLSYNIEDYIEHDAVPVTPEVIAVTVYIDQYPETMHASVHDEIHRKYLQPYTNMTQDEHFNMTEYVYQYYDT